MVQQLLNWATDTKRSNQATESKKKGENSFLMKLEKVHNRLNNTPSSMLKLQLEERGATKRKDRQGAVATGHTSHPTNTAEQ